MRAAFRKLEPLRDRFLFPGAPVWSTVLLGVACAVMIALVVWKTERSGFVPGTKSPEQQHVAGFDFGYASYFPVRDFLAGNNPYQPAYADRNPDGEGYPAYSPIHLLLHIPFAAFDFETARWTYFGASVFLLMVVAWLVVRIIDPRLGWNAVLLVALIMFASRPGYKTLFYGQGTALVMLGSYLALWKARDRSWLAGLGLAIVSIKAQFLVPLGILLLFRGNFRALLFGAFFSLAGSLAVVGVIAANQDAGDSITTDIYQNYIAPEEHPAVKEPGANWARMDFSDQVAKWTGMKFSSNASFAISFGIWLLGGLVLWRAKDREDLQRADGAAAAWMIGIVVISVYHIYYDFLFLTLPLCAALYGRAPFWKRIRPWQRVVILSGFGFGMANHLVEKANGFEVGSLPWKVGLTASSTALMVALAMLAVLLLKSPQTASEDHSE